jgi:hypothetical protein
VKTRCRKISVLEARELSRHAGVLITWRPDPALPEAEQYCLIHN